MKIKLLILNKFVKNNTLKDLFRVMRVTLILLFVLSFQLIADNTKAQDAIVKLKSNKVSVRQLINEIENQTDYLVVYSNREVNTSREVDLKNKLDKVSEYLSQTFEGTDIGYDFENNYIILARRESNNKTLEDLNTRITQQTGKTVTGKVVDANGQPIIGASIIVQGETSLGTVTDINGNYVLTNIPENAILNITYVGMQSQSISSSGRTSINVTLLEDTELLDEVVVVGYGVQKKINLTGAVDVVDGKKLQDRPVNNAVQAVAGTIPGLKISYGNAGFEPGATPSIQIRGQGTPYVLIDGVVGDLNTIDPNSIENISVLKDAAASAIYGARAPYGVMLVTTKNGKRNQKPQISLSMNAGPTTINNKPKMVDSYTFVRAMNEMHDNQGVSRLFSEETIDRIIARINDSSLPETVPDSNNPLKWSTYTKSNGNNDWVGIHFGNGFRSQMNLSIRGGGNDVVYFLSLGHAYEKGLFKMVTDKFNRYNINAKVDINITDWWKLSSNTRIIHSLRDKPIYNGEGEYGMLIHQIFRTHPEVFLKSPNGYYSQLSRIPQMQAGHQKFVDYNLIESLATEIKLTEKWTLNADFSLDFKNENFEGLNKVAYEDEVNGNLVPISLTVPSYITKDKDNSFYNTLNLYTSYNFNLKDNHHFNILIGYQQESNEYDWLRGLKRELISDEIPSITTATGEMLVYDDLSHWSTQGYFGRFNYNFDDRYLLESNIRYDGTSKFASGNRWGLFPSLSAGWNISREAFWETLQNTINVLKIKGSWGKLGNQNVVAYQDLSLLSVQNSLNWIIEGQRPPYTTAPNLINKNLSWESSQTINFGLEIGLLNNRLQNSLEYYQRKTFDRLGPAKALPAVIGAAIPQENNSELKTKGWDISLKWSDKIGDDLYYSITGNLSDYKNIVTKYPNPTGSLTTDYVGKVVGEIWGYETVGIIQTKELADKINKSNSQRFINGQLWQTGDIEYRDLNNDGKIDNGKNTIDDHGDLRVIGNSTPRYLFGLNVSAEFKNFDMSLFIQGTAKRDLWLTGNIFWGFNQWNQTSLFPHHLDYYRDKEESTYSGLGINTDAYFPRPYSNSGQDNKNKQIQTRYLQNGAFARLQNLQFGYKIPQFILSKAHLKEGRIYVSGENIYTLSRLTPGFDPETANLGQYGNGKGMFSHAVWAFGLNLSF